MSKYKDEDFELVTITVGKIAAATDAAVLCMIGDNKVWLPKSQIEGDVPEKGDEDVEIAIPRWLAEKHELS